MNERNRDKFKTRRSFLSTSAGAIMISSSLMPLSNFAHSTTEGVAAETEFDYVIVGAGSAGCVLANRLSAGGADVLVLEAGGPDKLPEIHNPIAWPGLMGTSVDWQYQTEPQANTLNRTHLWARGKVLGGSSSINAMAHHRGAPAGYNSWKNYGAKGWSFADLLPYFKKLETFSGGASEYHGDDGPIYIDVPRGDQQNPAAKQFIAASVATGYKPSDDINGSQIEGPTWNHIAQKDGKRQSSAVSYLYPALASETPPTVLTDAPVTQLLFKGKRCIGVEYLHNGAPVKVYAHKEVLLAAGALESPKLLMLSGVGPKQDLKAVGIKTRVALEGVGKNLQDHLLGAGTVYEAAQPVPLSKFQHGEAMQYLRTDSALSTPNLLLMFVSFPFSSFALPPSPSNGYTILPCIMQPKSKGSITLRSNNPTDYPIIDPNYFSEQEDLKTLMEGFDTAREIGANKELSEWRKREVYPAKYWKTAASRQEFTQQAANTFFHPVGTCAMGSLEESVVDSNLCVRGVENLRVIDASVMPRIPSAPTNAAVLAIAEKAADMILVSLL